MVMNLWGLIRYAELDLYCRVFTGDRVAFLRHTQGDKGRLSMA